MLLLPMPRSMRCCCRFCFCIYSPMHAGLSMIPMTVGALIAKSVATPLVRRFGYRTILTVNTLSLGAMIALFSLIGRDTDYWFMLLIFTVFGVINSMQFTAMNTVTLVDLSDRQASSGNSGYTRAFCTWKMTATENSGNIVLE